MMAQEYETRALRLEGVRREAEDDVGASSEMFKTEQTHSERVIDAQTLVSILILDVRVSSARMFSIARLVAGLSFAKRNGPSGGGPSFQCAGGTAKRLHQRALRP